MTHLKHYGIVGMKWGIRRYQNPDGSLTPRGARRLDRKDDKFIKTKGEKIKKKAARAISKDLRTYAEKELDVQLKSNGKLTAKTILQYNNKMAELMNNYIGDIPTPSGRVVRFVASRGNIGVLTGYADAGYDMSQVKQGVFSTGKVGYRDENLMRRGG
jgi:hypothetical protein